MAFHPIGPGFVPRMQEYRKVQRTGESSLALSLPKKWAGRYKVVPGSLLALAENADGTLTVSAGRARPRKPARFDVGGFPSVAEMQRAFIAKYLAGFSVFEFESEGRMAAAAHSAIARETKRLIGLEIVEEQADRMVVQDFFSADGMSVERGLRRAHSIACMMQEALSASLIGGDAAALKAAATRDSEIDRIRFLILRQVGIAICDSQLMRALALSPLDCLFYADAVTSVERIGDDIVSASRNADDALAGGKFGGEVAEFNDFAYSLQVLALKSFFCRSSQDANAVLQLHSTLLESRAALEKELAERSAPFQLGLVVDSIALIGNRGRHIAQAAINRSLQDAPDGT
ncbi:MAG: phosphate uptake regulator PhoU [Candidatus Micrarchaeota archaeon]